MRGQRRGIDGQSLILVFQLQIALQRACVDRLVCRAVSAVVVQLQIPPPFLDRVQAAVSDRIVQSCQRRCQFRHVHRSPAKRLFLEHALQIPRAGLHAPAAHRATLGRNPIRGAFLAVGFPDLIAVEHQLRTGCDCPRRAFPRAFVAAFAKRLQTEINRLVMRHRQVCRDDARFKARAQKRVQDHLADAADLAQTGQKQQRRLQNLAVHHRMGLGFVAQIADLPGDHPAQQRKPQIGTH